MRRRKKAAGAIALVAIMGALASLVPLGHASAASKKELVYYPGVGYVCTTTECTSLSCCSGFPQ